MTVVPFRRSDEPSPPYGAREALIDHFGLTAWEADNMLACLYVVGFKIVPLIGDE